ncbi:MAG: hypothetical protein IKQ87_06920 [Clostridia bacterium]|nr:hypothetical protein [Clostridia bacterium]
MNDGTYMVDVSLSGGTGRSSVKSPAELTVSESGMTARIEWSSPYYDLMIVDGERLLPVNTDGDSVFLVPVASLAVPLDVQAETVAMSEPHLIDYTLTFDASSVKASGGSPLSWIAGAAFLVSAAAAAFVIGRRIRKRRQHA